MRRPWNWVVRGLLACVLVGTSVIAAPPSSAQRANPAAVSLRGVTAAHDPAMVGPLRVAVEEALAAITVDDPHASRDRGGFVLDARVTQFSAETTAVGRRVDCDGSITVEDTRRHTLRGILTGRAHVIGDTGPALELAAIRAAARGAMRSLPTAIARH